MSNQNTEGYKYSVSFVIDVRRTDNKLLSDDENKMVLEMQKATEKVIAEIMANHGQDRSKHLGQRVKIY